jgi:short-subunit dehydrogenase
MQNHENPSHDGNWLVGKTVLITGATSGIGRALALLLNKNGSAVIAHGRSQLRLDSLVECAEVNDIVTVVGDLGQKAGWKAVESAILERRPDVMILNAGYNCRKEYASGWTDLEVFEMMQVNLISPILCARTFAGLPKLDEPRRMALILSTSCHLARAKMSLYVACKMGLMGFGKALQQEAKELGVRTMLCYPGRTNSSFRETPNSAYMDPESVAQAIASVLCLPSDVVPYEFTFRPEADTYI